MNMYAQGKLETKRVYKATQRKYTMNEVEKREWTGVMRKEKK